MLSIYLQVIDDYDDKNKFTRIYAAYKDLMLNRAFDILDDYGLAEDAVHNAFLSILKNMSKINDVNSEKARGYVMIVTENAAKKIYNREHKIRETELSDDVLAPSAEEEYVEKNSAELIKKNIDSLPEIYREVMILRYFNELSSSEIASVLAIPTATVRKRILRGKALLYSKIKEEKQE